MTTDASPATDTGVDAPQTLLGRIDHLASIQDEECHANATVFAAARELIKRVSGLPVRPGVFLGSSEITIEYVIRKGGLTHIVVASIEDDTPWFSFSHETFDEHVNAVAFRDGETYIEGMTVNDTENLIRDALGVIAAAPSSR